jgi:DNA polymerase-3 subunit gamma/tau
MAEPSLYRRHRPQSFEEVVGQEHVVRTLRNAVERDRVHHAYLFVGSRGTGKTSMAKILALSLNCVNGPTVTPCGQCEPCRTIAAGTSLDVIEMDAASNRSVDDIRELRERVGYAPAAGRWKVYILDEAHMLTREAWNAFLKTLEEPPPSTVFVLATTEPHKVMPTIVDRCQRFDFQRPSVDQITDVLRRVARLEEIEIEEGAIAAIARGATGSFRDALGTLDQLLAYCGKRIETADALAVLGVADAELILAAADAIANEDGSGALEVSERLTSSGRDVVQFGRDLISHLRQLLVARAAGGAPAGAALVAADPEELRAQAERLPEPAIVRSIDVLTDALAAIREGDDPRMTIEVALLRCARPQIDPSQRALAERLERLERRLDVEAPGGGNRLRVAGEVSAGEATAAGDSRAEPDLEPRGDGDPSAASIERIVGLWPAVVDQVRQSGSALLSSVYEAARPVSIDAENAVLKVGFPASAAFNKRKAEAQANRERFSEALRAVVGERLRPVYVLLEEDEAAVAGSDPELSEEELIDRIKVSFEAEEILEDSREEER